MAVTFSCPQKLTSNEFQVRIQIFLPSPGHFPRGQPGWVIPTSGTRSLGHQQDFTLLLAGSLFQVAFVLVGVTIGATHGHVVIVALMEGTESSSVSHTSTGGTAPTGVPPHPPCSLPALKPWENNREGHWQSPLTFSATKGEGGVFLKRKIRFEEIRGKVNLNG